MKYGKVEPTVSIKYTDENGVHVFSEGDNVICIVGEKRYIGRIVWLGTYQDNEEKFNALLLDMSDKNDKYNMTSEVINIDKITYLCKNPLR